MPIPTPEEQKAISDGIEYYLGGGGVSLVIGFYMAYDKFIKPKVDYFERKISKASEKHDLYEHSIKEIEDYIKSDREAFIQFSKDYADFKGHTEEAIERVDKAESRINDYIVESKATISALLDRFGDIKTGLNIQEGRVADLEKNERKHYEELKDMDSDNRIMDREITYLRNDMSEIKDTLRTLTSSFIELKEQLLKIAIKK